MPIQDEIVLMEPLCLSFRHTALDLNPLKHYAFSWAFMFSSIFSLGLGALESRFDQIKVNR